MAIFKRLFSSGFLHLDWQHLLFNMLTLYFFTHSVVLQLGVFNFYLIYFISLLTGNLLSFWFHKQESNYSAVGASGAVTGIVYAAILLNPGMKMFIYFIPIPIPSYIVGVGYLLFSIYGMKTKMGNIGHDAHFWWGCWWLCNYFNVSTRDCRIPPYDGIAFGCPYCPFIFVKVAKTNLIF